MEIRTLTKEEKEKCLTLATANERKNYIQTLIVDHWAKHKHLLVECFTSIGKSWIAKQAFTRYRTVYDKPINLICPTNSIRNQFQELIGHIPSVRMFLNAGYSGDSLAKDNYSCGVLAIDEAHHVAGSGAVRYPTILPRTTRDFTLLLTATIEKEEREFLETQGINHCFQIPVKTGLELGIVPDYWHLNVYVDFTEEEKVGYADAQEQFFTRGRLFQLVDDKKYDTLARTCLAAANKKTQNSVNIATLNYVIAKTGVSYGDVIGQARKYVDAVTRRTNIIYNAKNKVKHTLQLLDWLPKQHIIIFGGRLAIGDLLAKKNPLIQVYRDFGSSTDGKAKTKKLLDDFNDGSKPYLYGCNAIIEGLSNNKAAKVIDNAIRSKSRADTQKIGRTLRLDEDNPDKIARKINFICRDFELNGINYESQEVKWALSAQYGNSYVSWLDNMSELSEYLDDFYIP